MLMMMVTLKTRRVWVNITGTIIITVTTFLIIILTDMIFPLVIVTGMIERVRAIIIMCGVNIKVVCLLIITAAARIAAMIVVVIMVAIRVTQEGYRGGCGSLPKSYRSRGRGGV